MTLADAISTKVAQLPSDRQREVLDFVEFLAARAVQAPYAVRRDPEGLLAGQPSNLTLEDFAAARREVKANFPREVPE